MLQQPRAPDSAGLHQQPSIRGEPACRSCDDAPHDVQPVCSHRPATRGSYRRASGGKPDRNGRDVRSVGEQQIHPTQANPAVAHRGRLADARTTGEASQVLAGALHRGRVDVGDVQLDRRQSTPEPVLARPNRSTARQPLVAAVQASALVAARLGTPPRHEHTRCHGNPEAAELSPAEDLLQGTPRTRCWTVVPARRAPPSSAAGQPRPRRTRSRRLEAVQQWPLGRWVRPQLGRPSRARLRNLSNSAAISSAHSARDPVARLAGRRTAARASPPAPEPLSSCHLLSDVGQVAGRRLLQRFSMAPPGQWLG